MFQNDDQDCKSLQEPQIIAELQVKATYRSGSGDVVPCSRCAALVARNLPHVSYCFSEGEVENWIRTNVIDDTLPAILCTECEEPDQPSTQAAGATTHKQERSRA
jgi:hypothetical protein